MADHSSHFEGTHTLMRLTCLRLWVYLSLWDKILGQFWIISLTRCWTYFYQFYNIQNVPCAKLCYSSIFQALQSVIMGRFSCWEPLVMLLSDKWFVSIKVPCAKCKGERSAHCCWFCMNVKIVFRPSSFSKDNCALHICPTALSLKNYAIKEFYFKLSHCIDVWNKWTTSHC